MLGQELNVEEGSQVVLTADINVGGCRFLVPEDCQRLHNNHILLLDTGKLSVSTGDNDASSNYDCFDIATTGLSCQYSLHGDADSATKIIDAVNLNGDVQVCRRSFDPSLTRVIVQLELSATGISVSDRILHVLANIGASLIVSQPSELQPAQPAKPRGTAIGKEANKVLLPTRAPEKAHSSSDLTEHVEPLAVAHSSLLKSVKRADDEDSGADRVNQRQLQQLQQWVLLHVSLRAKGVDIIVSRDGSPLVEPRLVELAIDMKQRPLDREISVTAALFELCDWGIKPTISAARVKDFSATIVQAERDSPLAKRDAPEEQYKVGP